MYLKVLNIYVLDDDIPELNEYFRVTLVSAIPGDGKIGSTPTSGASIDPEKETTDITIKASDHPYGNQALVQEQSSLLWVYLLLLRVEGTLAND